MSDEDDDIADVERERQYWLDHLAGITVKRKQLDQDEREAVRQARFAGTSWERIDDAIGHDDNITAKEKYGEPDGDPF